MNLARYVPLDVLINLKLFFAGVYCHVSLWQPRTVSQRLSSLLAVCTWHDTGVVNATAAAALCLSSESVRIIRVKNYARSLKQFIVTRCLADMVKALLEIG